MPGRKWRHSLLGRLAPLNGVCRWVAVLKQSSLPDWEGCRVAVQESVPVFAKYTLENLRVMGNMSEKEDRVMQQMWQNVNNQEIWVMGMQLFVFFFFFKIYLFLAALGLHCCSWAFSCCGVQASHCSGFSRCRTRL